MLPGDILIHLTLPTWNLMEILHRFDQVDDRSSVAVLPRAVQVYIFLCQGDKLFHKDPPDSYNRGLALANPPTPTHHLVDQEREEEVDALQS